MFFLLQLHFLKEISMYYILLFHLLIIQLAFGNFLLHLMFVLQTHHPNHLLYIPMYLSNLEQLIHTNLLNHFLLLEILLLSKRVFLFFYVYVIVTCIYYLFVELCRINIDILYCNLIYFF